MSELTTDPVPNTVCPIGQLEFPAVSFSAVERFAGGDLLFVVLDPENGGVNCVDLETGVVNAIAYLSITGGTGRATGATGLLILTGTGSTVEVDSEGAVVLSSVKGTVRGTIVLAE